MKFPVLVAVLAIACSACVIDARSSKMDLFDTPKQLQVAVEPDTPIWLRVPAGDVRVTQANGSDLMARLNVRCPAPDSRCAKAFRDLELITETDQDGVHLALNKNSAFSYRNGDVKVIVAVPVGHPLHLDVTAGDVDVDVANCTEINMEAGDLTLKVPESAVRSVSIDTGIGDASLSRKGRRLSGRRSWLIGAELSWDRGPGQCDIVVDLQAGDAKVDLG